MDVIVAGGGIIGFAVAHELAARGAGVRICEARAPGQGATRASAGVLAPHIEGHMDPLLRLALRSLSLYDGFIGRVSSDAQEPVEYERSGTLQVACDGRGGDNLQEIARGLAAAGVEHTLLDGAAARKLQPALGGSVTGALLMRDHGYVAVPALMAALVSAAASQGVTVIRTHVQGFEPHGSKVHVRTDDGTLESDSVVIAAGSWSAQLTPAVPSLVRPIRGQLVHLRAPARLASQVIWGPDCYLVPWRDGSVLVGATVEDVGFDEAPTAGGVRHLLTRACEVMPALEQARFQDVRVGLRPLTGDELPVIGASSTMPGVFYATGHYRNGVLLAPVTARVIGDLLLDRRHAPELELVRPDRFGL